MACNIEGYLNKLPLKPKPPALETCNLDKVWTRKRKRDIAEGLEKGQGTFYNKEWKAIFDPCSCLIKKNTRFQANTFGKNLGGNYKCKGGSSFAPQNPPSQTLKTGKV